MTHTQVIVRLLRFLRPLAGLMTVSVVARNINFLQLTALVTVAAWGIGSYVATRSMDVVWVTLVSIVAIALVRGVSHWIEQFTGHYVAFRLLAMLRNEVYDRLEPLVPAATGDLRSGDAIGRAVNDCDRIEPFYAHTIAPGITALVVPTVLTVVLWFQHPWFAMAYAPFVLAMVLGVPWLIGVLGGHANQQWRDVQGQVNAFLTDSLQGLRDTIAFGYGKRRREELWAMGERLEHGQFSLVKADAFQRGLVDFLVAAAALVMLAIGAALAGEGAIAVLPTIPVVLAITITGFNAVSGFTNVISDYRVSISAAQRLFELLDREPVVRDEVAASAPVADASVVFEQVRFGYGKNGTRAEVLRGFDLEVPAGRHVALVGTSGAGKSTVASLLMRFWDPDSGRVRIGGSDVREMLMEDVWRQVSVVSQRNYIFNSTIGENIRMGKPDATDEEVDEAARRAHLLDWIRSLPDGYATRVGEGGSRLSGGQRQRVAIARALLKDAPILVLDEATSNLDVETEREVNAAIAELVKGKTVLTIAHRLSTVLTADEIAVLDRGVVVERGSHEELLARQGVYARLFALQQDEIDERLDTPPATLPAGT